MHHGSVEVPRQTLRFLCLLTADCEQTFLLERADNRHYLTFNSEFKADVAEGHGPSVCLQLADTADVVIVQVNVHKLLLFIHSAYGSKGRGSSCIVRVKNKKQMVDAPEITPNEC